MRIKSAYITPGVKSFTSNRSSVAR